MPKPLNFVCIVADQLRFDMLGCAGHPIVQTPHIDRLAGDGVRFDRCYTVQPMCMATRSTWLTGQTPRAHGVRCNGIPLRRDIPTITEALSNAGYLTHAIGKIHLNPWMPHPSCDPDRIDPAAWPEAITLWDRDRIRHLPLPYYGFAGTDALCGWWSGNYGQWLQARQPDFRDLVKPPPGIRVNAQGILDVPEQCYPARLPAELHYTHWATECSARFLNTAARAGKPFFLWHSIPDPHPPFSVAEPYFSMYRHAPVPPPRRRRGELDTLPPHYRQLYAGELKTAGRIASTNVPRELEEEAIRTVWGIVSQWDDMVGRLRRQLEQHGLLDNTVIVVMSDHGQMLGDHWMHSMPPTHLDGTLRVPSIWHAPSRFRSPHVTPALASHLDFAPTILELAGVPIPEGPAPATPEAPGQRPAWPGRSLVPVLTGGAASVQDSVIAENDEDYLGLRQRTVITASHHLTVYPGTPWGELFDLTNDPDQLFNQWDNPLFRETRRDLQILLMERFAETDSALPRRLGHA